MNYQVKLEVFEGPFDLLLHLIERNQLNIYDIPIAMVTDQFLEYIQTMQLLNLTVAGEFLVVAATLMQIKARLLLPKPPPVENPEEEDAEEDDPRKELIERLLEYKQFKDAAAELRQREEEWGRCYPRTGGEFPDQIMAAREDSAGSISVWDLIEAFREVLQSHEPRPELKGMPREETSVRERMQEIQNRLQTQGRLVFSKLFDGVVTRKGLITTFLALLELIRLRRVRVLQERPFEEIGIAIAEEGETVESH